MDDLISYMLKQILLTSEMMKYSTSSDLSSALNICKADSIISLCEKELKALSDYCRFLFSLFSFHSDRINTYQLVLFFLGAILQIKNELTKRTPAVQFRKSHEIRLNMLTSSDLLSKFIRK